MSDVGIIDLLLKYVELILILGIQYKTKVDMTWFSFKSCKNV